MIGRGFRYGCLAGLAAVSVGSGVLSWLDRYRKIVIFIPEERG